MLDFFIALFGGLYYGGKYLYYKGVEKECEADARQICIERRHFISEFCNEKLQEEIMRKLYDPAYADKVKAETEDVMSILPERDRFLPTDVRWNNEKNEKLRIILAKRGYLEWCAAEPTLNCNPGSLRHLRTNTLTRWIIEELARQGRHVYIADLGLGRYKVRMNPNGLGIKRIVPLDELTECSEEPLWQ